MRLVEELVRERDVVFVDVVDLGDLGDVWNTGKRAGADGGRPLAAITARY